MKQNKRNMIWKM